MKHTDETNDCPLGSLNMYGFPSLSIDIDCCIILFIILENSSYIRHSNILRLVISYLVGTDWEASRYCACTLYCWQFHFRFPLSYHTTQHLIANQLIIGSNNISSNKISFYYDYYRKRRQKEHISIFTMYLLNA